ncbi:GAF and ANTAR domain-containing protein [Actinoplanes sp. NPDC024001]|uniref:GAF and ANTAR domain-containing protein n=1 Tax=Actinoplanes sp. NPDC024001 TaxID=3154598 RepID=UPI0034059B9A
MRSTDSQLTDFDQRLPLILGCQLWGVLGEQACGPELLPAYANPRFSPAEAIGMFLLVVPPSGGRPGHHDRSGRLSELISLPAGVSVGLSHVVASVVLLGYALDGRRAVEVNGRGSSDSSGRAPWEVLADDLVSLAQVPDDDDVVVDALLARIAVVSAEVLSGVDYASITAWRGAGYTTVAASSDLARAVDDAQHAEAAGPCVQAEQTAAPVGVPDVAATMLWPGFYRQATELGLRASVSVPLFAGGGTPVGVLNLYGRDGAALAALTAGVREVFAVEGVPAGGLESDGDAGTRQFLAGLGQALRLRVTIQRAVGVLMALAGCDAAQAYRMLREWAASLRESLSGAALRVIVDRESKVDTAVQVTVGPATEGVVSVSVTGELALPLDAAAARRLAAPLGEAAAVLQWDLSGLRFCDLAGLRLLLDLRRQIIAGGRQMRVVAASEAVHLLLLFTETAPLFGYPPPASESAGDAEPAR